MGKAALIALVLLAGCQTVSVEDPRKVWCEFNQPRRDATETTPRSVLDEINAHNDKGRIWCHWNP
jgi:hypothetical protein